MINNPFPGTPEAERAALRAKLRILPSPKGWVFHTTGDVFGITLQGSNISRCQGTFEDDFPNFPRWDMSIPWRVIMANGPWLKSLYLQFCLNIFFFLKGRVKTKSSQPVVSLLGKKGVFPLVLFETEVGFRGSCDVPSLLLLSCKTSFEV